MAAEKVIVVIPTYNEADNLPTLAADVLALPVPNLSILVVDDNSPDGTGQIADEISRRQPDRFQVLHRSAKEGLGRAYVAGFQWALAQGADYVVQMDCDFSHAPRHIVEMLEQIHAYDVVVGSRYVAGGQVDNRWEYGRFLLSWWANAVYTRLLLRLRVHDSTAGFKCWRAETLRGIGLHAISSHGYSFQFEMAYLTEKLGYRVLEIPIYFEDRRIGRSKMSVPIKLEAAARAWHILWKYRRLGRRRRARSPEPIADEPGRQG